MTSWSSRHRPSRTLLACLAALGLVATGATTASSAAAAPSPPTALWVSLLAQPLAISDLTAPRLSWEVPAGDGDVHQTAWQVRVARSPDELASGRAVWDSGRTSGATSTAVPYAGPTLEPGRRYSWSVRTWTTTGGQASAPSAWSAPADFGTAPATWDATPIWGPAADDGTTDTDYTVSAKLTITGKALGLQFRARSDSDLLMWQFRRDTNTLVPHTKVGGTFTALPAVPLPAGARFDDGAAHAVAITATGDRFVTTVDGVQVDDRTIAGFGAGTIGFRTGSAESGLVDDVQVKQADGTVLYANDFTDGVGDFACGTPVDGQLSVPASVGCTRAAADNWAFLRDEPTLRDQPIRSATLYATARSAEPSRQYVYRMSINGRFVGVGPARSADTGQTLYNAYDVTSLLQPGKPNALAAQVDTTADKRFLAELVVTYADGSTQTIGTGPDWRALGGADVLPAAGSVGTSYFTAPVENLDARRYPTGWDRPGFDDSGWRAPTTKAAIDGLTPTPMTNTVETDEAPTKVTRVGPGHWVVDFGRTWIGGMKLRLNGTAGQQVDLRMGEELNPDGSVRYKLRTGNAYRDTWTLRDGEQTLQHWGYRVFRYAELTGLPPDTTADDVRAAALHQPFTASDASFGSDDPLLDQVWSFARDSVDALTLDQFLDSATRERGAEYGGDTYVTLLARDVISPDRSVGRFSHEWSVQRPSWPTEWRLSSVIDAWEDWQQTGDIGSAAAMYDKLTAFLPTTFDADGLVQRANPTAGAVRDIVDWPDSERDGYVFTPVNTVINAWSYRAYRDMAELAAALGHRADAASFDATADRIRAAMNAKLWDPAARAYVDGLQADGTPIAHRAIQATVFPLSFGVPDAQRSRQAADTVAARGMACSVFCAHFVLDGLVKGGRADAAVAFMTDDGLRSWRHMIDLGAGAVMEAWDPSLKSNLTYSHPWAAGPVSAVSGGLLGLRPLSPGWSRFSVHPRLGSLHEAHLTTPTVRGTVRVSATRDGDGDDRVRVSVPGNATADVALQRAPGGIADRLWVDGRPVPARVDDDTLSVDVGSGDHVVTVRAPQVVPPPPPPSDGGGGPAAPPPAGPAPAARVPVIIGVRSVGRRRLASIRSRGVPVRVRCSANAAAQVRLEVSAAMARRLHRAHRSLGTTRFRCRAGRTVTVIARPSVAATRALLRSRPSAVRLTATAISGRDRSSRSAVLRR